MRVFRRRHDRESPEMKTPSMLKEHVKSHPLDIDSDSEASFTSALDNQGDFQPSPGVTGFNEPTQSPLAANDKEHRIKQQASSQTADHIATHTPTMLSNAKGMGDSVQYLAHEVASAAAHRASNLLQELEAAGSNNNQSPGTSNQYIESIEEQNSGMARPSKTTTSLADITNSAHDRPPTHLEKKMTSQSGAEGPDMATSLLDQTPVCVEAKSTLALLVIDWAMSNLYYSSGVAAAITQGIARGLTAKH